VSRNQKSTCTRDFNVGSPNTFSTLRTN
jgi:hypothetical protein